MFIMRDNNPEALDPQDSSIDHTLHLFGNKCSWVATVYNTWECRCATVNTFNVIVKCTICQRTETRPAVVEPCILCGYIKDSNSVVKEYRDGRLAWWHK